MTQLNKGALVRRSFLDAVGLSILLTVFLVAVAWLQTVIGAQVAVIWAAIAPALVYIGWIGGSLAALFGFIWFVMYQMELGLNRPRVVVEIDRHED